MIKEHHTYLTVLVIFLASVGAFLFLHSCDKKIDRGMVDPNLAPGVVEKVVINPNRHTLTVVTPGHEETLFLPDRPSSIEIGAKGDVKVTSRQFGTELKPFFGLQQSNMFRVGAGLDLLYWKKLDLGLGVADKVGNYVPVVFVKLSYLVWSNSQVGITFDSSSHVGMCLTVRL